MERRINQQIFASLLMFVASVGLLFFDSESSQTGVGVKSEQIGVLESEFKNTNRRSMGDLDWTKITDQDALYQGDLVFTNQNTVARINIGDTYRMNLDQLTLVKLVFNKKNPKVELKKGSIDLTLKDPNKKVTVVVGEKQVVFSGKDSKVLIEKKDGDHYQVKSIEGTFSFIEKPLEQPLDRLASLPSDESVEESEEDTEKGNVSIAPAVVLNEGQVMDSRSRIVQRERVCVEYLAPQSLQKIDLSQDSKVRFSWKSTCRESNFKLEVATDSQFKNVIRSVEVNTTEKEMFFDSVSSAPLFWRVKSALGTSFHPQSFIALNEPKPTLVAIQVTADEKEMVLAEAVEDEIPDYSPRKPANLEQPILPTHPSQNIPQKPVIAASSDEVTENEEVRVFRYTVGVGISNNRYQDGVVSINQLSITPKISASYQPGWLDGRLRFTANTFVTALPLASTKVQIDPLNDPSLTDDVSMRFWGLNARGCYLLNDPISEWRFELSAGWYYNASFVTKNYFGYSGVSGPQIFPSLEKTFSNGSVVGSYVKYSPVSGGLAIMNVGKNYEAAFGTYYLLPRKSPKSLRWALSADFSRLTLDLPGTNIRSDNLTLGTSLQF